MNTLKVAIIGGGLSGLYTAFLLSQINVDYVLIEARDRLGGRILSTPAPGPQHDLGPAWMWPDFQPRMAVLVESLGLSAFRQYSAGAMLFERSAQEQAKRTHGFESGNASMRIQGSVNQIINALAARLPTERVVLNTRVCKVQLHSSTIELHTPNAQSKLEGLGFSHVITALPLRLLDQDISFEPALDPAIHEHWSKTPTWMAPHAKYIALYDQPFWREDGLSGMAQSQVGPMVEIHDASDLSGSAALFGFIGIPAAVRQTMNDTVLLEQCRRQLVRLFGHRAAAPIAHYVKDWAKDEFTATQSDRETIAGHSRTRPFEPVQNVWSTRLLIAGTEASDEHGGYMEGALDAAEVSVSYLRTFSLL
jgi:monoamine oxidase